MKQMKLHREIKSIVAKSGVPEKAMAFSPNLQRFLRVHPMDSRVYLDPVTRIWYLGFKDGDNWGGALMLRALCVGGRAETFSYGTSITNRFVDRTEQFWKCAAYFGRRMFPKWY